MRPVHVLLLLFIMAVWGFNFVVAKVGLAEFPPLLFMALRFVLASTMLVWFAKPPGRLFWRLALLSITMGSLHFSLMFTGLTRVDASIGSIAVQLQVPFAALLAAAVFKDRLGWRRAAGMAVAFAGVVLIAGQPRISTDIVYLLCVIGASFIWATGNVQIKALAETDSMSLNAWISILAAPQLILLSLIFEDGQLDALATASWLGWGAVVYMALVVAVVSYGVWYAMIKRYPTNQTMPYTLLVPVFGVLAGVFVLGEPFAWQVAVGGVATVAGVGVIVMRRPRLAGPEA